MLRLPFLTGSHDPLLPWLPFSLPRPQLSGAESSILTPLGIASLLIWHSQDEAKISRFPHLVGVLHYVPQKAFIIITCDLEPSRVEPAGLVRNDESHARSNVSERTPQDEMFHC